MPSNIGQNPAFPNDSNLGEKERKKKTINVQRFFSTREASTYLGISRSTLNRIEKQGLLVPFRTPGGHRRYDLKMLEDCMEKIRRSFQRYGDIRSEQES